MSVIPRLRAAFTHKLFGSSCEGQWYSVRSTEFVKLGGSMYGGEMYDGE